MCFELFDDIRQASSHFVFRVKSKMDAFETHFAPIAGDIVELNVSLGPTGELRYPAYNGDAGWSFPDRGNFQAYSRLARESFRGFALTISGSSSGNLGPLNARWGTTLNNVDQIRPPGGDMGEDSQPCPAGVRRAQDFVNLNDHRDTPYGIDFVGWYNGSLADHGRRVLTEAHPSFYRRGNGQRSGVWQRQLDG